MKSKKNLKRDLIESLGDGTYTTRNHDLERSLLKTCLYQQDKIALAAAVLSPQHFSDPRLRDIFATVLDMYQNGRKILANIVLAECLRKPNDNIDPDDYREAIDAIVKSEQTDVESASSTLNDLYIARKLQAFAHDVALRASEGDDIHSLIAGWEGYLRGIMQQSNTVDHMVDLDVTMKELPRGVRSIMEPDTSGISTPWPALNDLIYGFRGGDIATIGGRPGMGKSVMLANISYHAAKMGKIVQLYAHEMKTQHMWRRIMCAELSVNNVDVNRRELSPVEDDRCDRWLREEASRFLMINDCTGKTPASVRSDILKKKAKYGDVGLVCIDYLQLMQSGRQHKNRHDEVTDIIRSLKAVSKETDTPIVVASAMNRGIEHRQGKDKRPQLSDLNESGNIEADSTIVIFTHRPSVYGVPANGPVPDDELIVCKNREGRQGVVPVRFMGQFYRFDSI